MPTITTGGTAQTALAELMGTPAQVARTGFALQNLSPGDLWFREGGAATQGEPSLRLPPGAYFEAPRRPQPYGAVSIIGATAGQAFAVWEW
jgi:hypothetical protein